MHEDITALQRQRVALACTRASQASQPHRPVPSDPGGAKRSKPSSAMRFSRSSSLHARAAPPGGARKAEPPHHQRQHPTKKQWARCQPSSTRSLPPAHEDTYMPLHAPMPPPPGPEPSPLLPDQRQPLHVQAHLLWIQLLLALLAPRHRRGRGPLRNRLLLAAALLLAILCGGEAAR